MRSGLAKLSLGLSAWRHGLVQPFYVPNDLPRIRMLIAIGAISDATQELLRLARLGQLRPLPHWATCSWLAAHWKILMALASKPYVVSPQIATTALLNMSLLGRNTNLATLRGLANWLRLSARQRFAPAICDMGRLAIIPRDKSRRRPNIARRSFRLAFFKGHLMRRENIL